ncbi:hypothetical protein DAT35_30495 [Vitiosangium sp. GDMCC 1.1324]|nr:hypothetical protein DAT35_30495 [Vitiosangium sp. GDMCC 1.1324]
MANEKDGKDEGLEPLQLGRRYEEVGPELGCLHETRDAHTGRATLTLFPDERTGWKPEGPWRMRLSCQQEPPSVTLAVEQAPTPLSVPELVNILTLMTAAVELVEDNPQVQAHLARGRVRQQARWLPGAVAGFAVLALALGVWIHGASGPKHLDPSPASVDFRGPSQANAPDWINAEDSQTTSINYPLPKEPFRNQAKAPCRTKAGQVEINGGCWVALEQKPPCAETQAEYQGKCYLPVGKDQSRPPQSVEP